MKKNATLILFIFLSAQCLAQNYATGIRVENYVDASRSNRQISTTVYYPANVAGNNAALAAGNSQFPVVVFGHGFVIDPSSYRWLADSLVKHGYVVAFPATEGGALPSHSNFGKDLSFLCGYIPSLNDVPGSFFFGRLIKKSAVGGHSMGGGASFLAASGNTTINAIFNFSAAETNPSAITAAASVTAPSLIFSGSSDCIVPANTQQSMYEKDNAACKTYIDITNALHCQYANNNGTCVLGQVFTGCNSSPLSPANVFGKVTNLLIPFLDYYLKSECTAGDNFISNYNTITGVTKMQSCLALPSCGALPVTLHDFYGKYNNNAVTLSWSAGDAINFKNFIVEKSMDASSFTAMATIGSNATNKFIARDEYPYPGISYYRLKIIDNDGAHTYSNILKISTGSKKLSLTGLFPNPVRDIIQFELVSEKNQTVLVDVFSAEGKRVAASSFNVTKGVNVKSLNVGNLSAGFYTMQLQNKTDGVTISAAIIKK